MPEVADKITFYIGRCATLHPLAARTPRRTEDRTQKCREYALSRFSLEAKAANIAEFVAHICALAENNKKESK